MDPHANNPFPLVAPWADPVANLGIYGVWFAFIAFVLSALLSARERTAKPSSILAFAGSAALFVAFASLASLMVGRQYQFKYVFGHSENALSIGYRIAAIWGGQEGSFLLWASLSALCLMVVWPFTGPDRRLYTGVGSVLLAFLSAILAYESPFLRVEIPADLVTHMAGRMPADGQGMNLALLNYWMQIHPPTIFLGFGSLAPLFAWAVAVLIRGNFTDWMPRVRPWAIVSMSVTGLGVVMGGFWAYETLGWGGFWKWDPVENASIVPWFLTTAFLHNLIVQRHTNRWPIGTAMLAGGGFVAFCYGTFLTRSGFLGDTSVHSFAAMEASALKFLIGLLAVAATTLIGLGIWRGITYKGESPNPNREPKQPWNLLTAYAGTSMLVSALGVACAIGMSVPLIQSLRGQAPKVVEETVYNRLTVWFFLPTVLLMAVGPFLTWRGLNGREVGRKVFNSLTISIGVVGALLLIYRRVPDEWAVLGTATMSSFAGPPVPTLIWTTVVVLVCVFGIVANLQRVIEVAGKQPQKIGAFLTHVGVITIMVGLVISRSLEQRAEAFPQSGTPVNLLGYETRINPSGQPINFMERENQLPIRLTGRGDEITLQPVLYYTESPEPGQEPTPTVRPAIHSRAFYDLYLTAHPLIFDATEPTPIKPGESRAYEGITIRYNKLEREGEVGAKGTKFIANLTITDSEGHAETVRPSLQITDQGPAKNPVQVGELYYLLDRLDAADNTAYITIQYVNPIVPIELYFKPMTGLVWWGTGIMFFGGLLAAWQRRMARSKAPAPATITPSGISDAVSPTPEV